MKAFAKRLTVAVLLLVSVPLSLVLMVLVLTGIFWVLTGNGFAEVSDFVDRTEKRITAWLRRP